MTLQPDNGAPTFYTFTCFSPGKIFLLYGGLLSAVTFCAVALLFNYGIREKLWSYETIESIPGTFASSATLSGPAAGARTDQVIRRIFLSDSVLRSLEGVYYSQAVNRTYLLTVEAPRIYLQAGKQEKIELVPVSSDTLYAGEGWIIKFAPDSAAQVNQLDIYDNGNHLVARRQ